MKKLHDLTEEKLLGVFKEEASKLPASTFTWTIEPLSPISARSASCDFYQTPTYSLEGFYKPIAPTIDFRNHG